MIVPSSSVMLPSVTYHAFYSFYFVALRMPVVFYSSSHACSYCFGHVSKSSLRLRLWVAYGYIVFGGLNLTSLLTSSYSSIPLVRNVWAQPTGLGTGSSYEGLREVGRLEIYRVGALCPPLDSLNTC